MGKYILLFALFAGMLLSGCYNEDAIYAEEGSYRRAYDTTSTDPVFKFVSRYYYDYGKLLITDPDSADYLFNFQTKHLLSLTAPEQSQEHLAAALDFFKKMFLNGYSEKIIKDYFPYKILLADTVRFTGNSNDYRDIYLTEFHISFLVNEEMLNKSEADKIALSREWNYKFLAEYMAKYKGWKVDEDFYLYSTDDEYYKNFSYETSEEWTEDNFWELGYASGQVYEKYGQKPDGSWGMVKVGYQFAASRAGYLEDYIEFLYSSSEETIAKACKHEKFKKAYDVLVTALNGIGIDYRNIGYEAN